MNAKPGPDPRMYIAPLLLLLAVLIIVLAMCNAPQVEAQGYRPADCMTRWDGLRVVAPYIADLTQANIDWLYTLVGDNTGMFLGYHHEFGNGDYSALAQYHWNMPAGAYLNFLARPRGGLGWRNDFRFVMVYAHDGYPGRLWVWVNTEPETENENGRGYHGTCFAVVEGAR